MLEFIKLANFLDNSENYLESDLMMKIAFDLGDQNPTSSGYYGHFYSKLNPELKNQIGRVDPDFAIKEYKNKDNPRYRIIYENLALKYFSPIINSQTDLQAPNPSFQLSIPGAIYHYQNMSSTLPGVHIDERKYKHALVIQGRTEEGIKSQLQKVGIYAADLHSGNYKVNPKLIDEAIEFLDELYDLTYLRNKTEDQKKRLRTLERDTGAMLDLSSNASVFDFGEWQCDQNSEVGKNLIALQDKLIKARKNKKSFVLDELITIIGDFFY